jgi:hypothetical protein
MPLGAALHDIDVRVWAELGRTRMPTGQVVGLPGGAIVELDREAEDASTCTSTASSTQRAVSSSPTTRAGACASSTFTGSPIVRRRVQMRWTGVESLGHDYR